jgi:hypothetical protein
LLGGGVPDVNPFRRGEIHGYAKHNGPEPITASQKTVSEIARAAGLFSATYKAQNITH